MFNNACYLIYSMADKKHILVTGGAGLIGSHICKKIVEEGEYTLVIVDLFIQYISPIKQTYSENRYARFAGIEDKVIIERANCANYAVMYDLIEKYKPEYIIHLAALPLAKINSTTPDDFREGTVDATANILHIIYSLKQKGADFVKKFVYTSSSMVYGNFVEDPIKESSATNPISVYGTMKLAGEIVTNGLCATYDLPYAIIRPSAVYGPTDMNRRVTQIFVENAMQGKKLIVMGGEEEKLDFSYVTDVANGFVLAMKSDISGETFNVTGGNAQSLLDFAKLVKNHFPETEIEIQKREKGRPTRGGLDISKAKELLGYSPKYDIKKGVNEYIEHLKKKKN